MYTAVTCRLEYIVWSRPTGRMAVHKLWIENGAAKCGIFSRKVHLYHRCDGLLGPRSGCETPVRNGLPTIGAARQGGRRVSACQSAQSFNASRESRTETRGSLTSSLILQPPFQPVPRRSDSSPVPSHLRKQENQSRSRRPHITSSWPLGNHYRGVAMFDPSHHPLRLIYKPPKILA